MYMIEEELEEDARSLIKEMLESTEETDGLPIEAEVLVDIIFLKKISERAIKILTNNN